MIELFRAHGPNYASDAARLAANGIAYGKESSGFHDWLKKGIPEPVDPTTVFVELRSTKVLPVLWATGGWVGIPTAFIATEEVRAVFENQKVTGVEWAPVQIVKVASKGARKRILQKGEPEDLILKRRNLLPEVELLPLLWGARVNGLCEVSPDAGSWNADTPTIQPYSFSKRPDTDLFRASRAGEQYGGHLFCTKRFREVCEHHKFVNIVFTPFSEWRINQWS